MEDRSGGEEEAQEALRVLHDLAAAELRLAVEAVHERDGHLQRRNRYSMRLMQTRIKN